MSHLTVYLVFIFDRLYLLVKLYGGVQVAEYSSSLTPQQRKAILRDFRLGKVQLLICSDAMARGMDIQDVTYVISYDVPNYVRSYIHRVGRTARAGNKGTLVVITQCVFMFETLSLQRFSYDFENFFPKCLRFVLSASSYNDQNKAFLVFWCKIALL